MSIITEEHAKQNGYEKPEVLKLPLTKAETEVLLSAAKFTKETWGGMDEKSRIRLDSVVSKLVRLNTLYC